MAVKKEIVGKDKDGNEINVVVVAPKPEHHAEANLASQKLFAKLVSEVDETGKPVMMLRTQAKAVMENRGLWSKEKDEEVDSLVDQINKMRRKLAAGGITLNEGKNISIKIRDMTADLYELQLQKACMEPFTIEAKTEGERVDYLITKCVLHDDGTPVFDSVEAYRTAPQEPWMVEAGKAIGDIILGIDMESERKLPENKFLLRHGFANAEGRFVRREDGKLVDEAGRLIDKVGRYINENDEYVDRDGNRVDEDGFPLVDDAQPFLDEDGNPILEVNA